MISLIKNEMIKLFHKKSLWVLCILLFGYMLFSFLLHQTFGGSASYDSYLESEYHFYKGLIDDYNVNNKDQAADYADAKTMLEVTELLMKYNDKKSPEHYFISNEIIDVLRELNYAKYVTKIDDEINSIQKEYDLLIQKLENYDWEFEVTVQREEYLKEIELLNKMKDKNEISEKEIENSINALNVHIKAIDYRLKLGVPPSDTNLSYVIDNYENYAISYMEMEKDEKSYKSRQELINKRNTEESYRISEYKLENNLVYEEEQENLIDGIVYLFMYVDVFVLLALIIVSGGIIADEFNNGTIKQLLVKPFSRNKVLLSKMIAAFLVSALFVFIYFSAYILYLCADAGDFSVLFSSVVDYNFITGKAFSMSLIPYCITCFVSLLPQYFIIFAFVLFMGVLTTNAVGAICSGFCLYFFADFINYSVSSELASFLPISCWDLSCYLFGGLSTNPSASFTKSIIVCVITFILLIAGCFILFKNKDIKNQ